jgi:hypothetical protein
MQRGTHTPPPHRNSSAGEDLEMRLFWQKEKPGARVTREMVRGTIRTLHRKIRVREQERREKKMNFSPLVERCLG